MLRKLFAAVLFLWLLRMVFTSRIGKYIVIGAVVYGLAVFAPDLAAAILTLGIIGAGLLMIIKRAF